jgi:hypothetical protein
MAIGAETQRALIPPLLTAMRRSSGLPSNESKGVRNEDQPTDPCRGGRGRIAGAQSRPRDARGRCHWFQCNSDDEPCGHHCDIRKFVDGQFVDGQLVDGHHHIRELVPGELDTSLPRHGLVLG